MRTSEKLHARKGMADAFMLLVPDALSLNQLNPAHYLVRLLTNVSALEVEASIHTQAPVLSDERFTLLEIIRDQRCHYRKR
jgi:hypothetical protein